MHLQGFKYVTKSLSIYLVNIISGFLDLNWKICWDLRSNEPAQDQTRKKETKRRKRKGRQKKDNEQKGPLGTVGPWWRMTFIIPLSRIIWLWYHITVFYYNVVCQCRPHLMLFIIWKKESGLITRSINYWLIRKLNNE